MNKSESTIIVSTSPGIVELNPNFKEYDKLVRENPHPSNTTENIKYFYTCKEDQIFLKYAMNHIQKFSREITSDNVLVLVHPFYSFLEFSNMFFNNHKLIIIESYVNNLLNIFKLNYESKLNLQIVVMETLRHYAAGSNILLQNGLVDKVIITPYDSGFMNNSLYKEELSNRSLYFGGGFNGSCLTSSVDELVSLSPSSSFMGVTELCLEHPNLMKYTGIHPIGIDFHPFLLRVSNLPMISLEKFYDTFKKKK